MIWSGDYFIIFHDDVFEVASIADTDVFSDYDHVGTLKMHLCTGRALLVDKEDRIKKVDRFMTQKEMYEIYPELMVELYDKTGNDEHIVEEVKDIFIF